MFSEELKRARKRAGKTQVQLAAELGVSNGTVAMWETGKREPDYEMLRRIAETLDTTSGVLLGEAGILEFVAADNGLKNAMQFFEDEREEKGKPTPVSESGSNRNVLRLAGRDGSYVERNLTDEQMAAIKMMIEQLPDADDL